MYLTKRHDGAPLSLCRALSAKPKKWRRRPCRAFPYQDCELECRRCGRNPVCHWLSAQNERNLTKKRKRHRGVSPYIKLPALKSQLARPKGEGSPRRVLSSYTPSHCDIPPLSEREGQSITVRYPLSHSDRQKRIEKETNTNLTKELAGLVGELFLEGSQRRSGPHQA